MGKYDDNKSSYGGSGKTDYSNWYKAIANELAIANNLKKIEIDLLAYKAGITKEKRKELQELMEEA